MVLIPDADALDLGAAFSLAFWVRNDALEGGASFAVTLLARGDDAAAVYL